MSLIYPRLSTLYQTDGDDRMIAVGAIGDYLLRGGFFKLVVRNAAPSTQLAATIEFKVQCRTSQWKDSYGPALVAADSYMKFVLNGH